MALEPVNRGTNISSSMHIGRRCIPEDREETPISALCTQKMIAKADGAILDIVKPRVAHRNDSSVSHQRHSCAARENQCPTLASCDTSRCLQRGRQQRKLLLMQCHPENGKGSAANSDTQLIVECYVLCWDDCTFRSPGANQVGFLSGGRSKRMKELPQKEVLAQLEEAYARATVALTRAQKLCIIMGPLDMRGLLGAATVIGCLKYGAGVCGVHDDNPSAEVFLKERSLDAGPDDSAFIASLRRSLNTPRGHIHRLRWRRFTAKTSIP